jgi:hypothetical protein
MPEWGICAVRLDEARRRVTRVRFRLDSAAHAIGVPWSAGGEAAAPLRALRRS